MNKLYLGDNLQIMRGMEDESVDLVIADGPFFSQQRFNDFNDRWKSIEAYLEFMMIRCKEMYRLLKSTGSFYLHCDQAASHYLKVKLDKVFGYNNFQNQIIWAYNSGGGTTKRFGRKHDVLLFYSKSSDFTFHADHVRVSYSSNISEKMAHKFHKDGKVSGDVISIKRLANQAKERTGYSTQKPKRLYQFFIKASSNKGDLIFDPFCGSGTTLDAAESLGRRWIGIDQNPESIQITDNRMKENYSFLCQYEVVHHE